MRNYNIKEEINSKELARLLFYKISQTLFLQLDEVNVLYMCLSPIKKGGKKKDEKRKGQNRIGGKKYYLLPSLFPHMSH